MQTIVATSRRPRPRFLIATLFAFSVSGFFVGGTIIDVSGTHEDSRAIATLEERAEVRDDVGYDPFSRDAIIGGTFFGIMALITVGCVAAFSGARRQLDFDPAEGVLHLRKHASGKSKTLALTELTKVSVAEEEFDDALAQSADANRPIPTKLYLESANAHYVVECESRRIAIKAQAAIEELRSGRNA